MATPSNEFGWGTRTCRIRPARALRAVLLLLLLWTPVAPAPAQTAERGDAAAVADAIERLPVVGSVLLTGAHPDDENNALLAYLARGLHLRTAYLSATRGDGGQNLLGNEQYEALGILRTEELMAARRIDGAEQFFANAYDFGFSKSAAETLEKWGHEKVLRDYVRVIRRFRPDVIISRFSGTRADGHGHHEASGILTKEAFIAAADPARFPELADEGLQPWQARYLFINRGGGGGGGGRPAGGDAITLMLGGISPIYGEEFGELGTQARSQHRSQGMGQAGGRGPYSATFVFENAAPGLAAPPKELFAGVDLTLHRFTALSGNAPAVAERVAALEKLVVEARRTFSPFEPGKVLPLLAEGLGLLRELPSEINSSGAPSQNQELARYWLEKKEQDFERAIALAGGVVLDALADTAEVVPGSSFTVTLLSRARETGTVRLGEAVLRGPEGWRIERLEPAALPAAGDSGEAKFKVTVPADAAPSQPYWLAAEREGDYFNAPPAAWSGAAHQPALLEAAVRLTVASPAGPVEVVQRSEVVYRFADRIYGQREKPLAVLPRLGVWLEPEVAVFPQGERPTRVFLARVRNNSAAEQRGTIKLQLPAAWQSNPPPAAFSLGRRGEEVAVRFEVTPPGNGATSELGIKAVAESGGEAFSLGYRVIDYPHVQTRYWFRPAAAKLERFEVKVAPGLRVGYVMGSGDAVPEALKQLGVEVTELTTDDLAFGNLSRFDVILTGIRAYEVRQDISANHARLMEWVKSGGVMIVQYSRPGGFSDILSPYPMRMDASLRVAVEEAPVEILEPEHPLFHFPNEITARDFAGWVQERGTYFMASWAPEFTPLLASNDPGEPPQEGGMLLARYGDGYYLYTGYAWFRQLPAGVPGAYRIFANMISLGKQ